MCNQIKAKSILDTTKLFWGNLKVQSLLEEDKREEILNIELLDWISTLYWAEGLAARYALKMSEQIAKDREDAWKKVYSDEFRHQTMIATWLNERGMAPNPPNLLIKYAENQVSKLSAKKDKEEVVKVIERSQLFFEELLHSLIRYRLPGIIDRDLKSILSIIYRDEADHLAKGRNEVKELEGQTKDKKELLQEYSDMVFPIHLGKNYLPEDIYNQTKEVTSVVTNEFIEESLSIKSPFNIPDILKKFSRIPGYRCVACSPMRSDGLHLEPKHDAIESKAYDEIVFPNRTEGFPSFVHGGAISMALDEMLGYAVILNKNQLPLTKKLELRYLKPVIVGSKYRIESKIVEENGQTYKVQGDIIDIKTSSVSATAYGDFYVPKQKLADMVFGRLAQNSTFKEMVWPDES